MTHATLSAERIRDAALLAMDDYDRIVREDTRAADAPRLARLLDLYKIAVAATWEEGPGRTVTVSLEDFALISSRYGQKL